MTFAPPDGPLPELSTTRVAGGTSARLVAVAVAGLLVAVVGFAALNRPAPPPVAVAPSTAQPTPSASVESVGPAPTAPPDEATIGQIVPPGASPVYDGYGVELVVAGRRYPGQLFTVDSERMSAVYRFPAALASDEATLGLAKVTSSFSHDMVMPIGSWDVPLQDLDAIHGAESTLVDEVVAGEPLNTGAPPLVQSGYRISVRFIAPPDETPRLVIDVLAGAGTPQPRVYSYAVSMETTGGLLRAVLKQDRCRWDTGPQAAAPRGTHDEATCPGQRYSLTGMGPSGSSSTISVPSTNAG